MPPTVTIAAGGSCDINGTATTATITLALTDPDPAALTLTATSSDQALLPNTGLTTAGSGATRTLTAATNPARSGRATVTVTVSDGAVRSRGVMVVGYWRPGEGSAMAQRVPSAGNCRSTR